MLAPTGYGIVQFHNLFGVIDHVANETNQPKSLADPSVARGDQAGELRAVPKVQPGQAAARGVQQLRICESEPDSQAR
jgi:hypothetical protein